MRSPWPAECVFDDGALGATLDGLHQELPRGLFAVVFLKFGANRHPAAYWSDTSGPSGSRLDPAHALDIVFDNLDGVDALEEGVLYPRAVADTSQNDGLLPSARDMRTLRRDAYDLIPLYIGEAYAITAFVGYHSSVRDPDIAAGRDRLREVAPSLAGVMAARAAWIARRQQDALAVIGAIDTPVILCGENLRFVGMNDAARDFVSGQREVAAVEEPAATLIDLGAEDLVDDILSVKSAVAARLISTMPDGRGGSVSVSATRHFGSRTPMLATQEQLELTDPPAWLISFSNPRHAAERFGQAVIDKHGFSRAETRLLKGLLSGNNLSEFAAAHSLSYNTVRNQLASIYQKAGVHRQADLIRKFSGMH